MILMAPGPSTIVKTDQKRSLETKKRILDATEQLFAQHGFYGTSMRDIAALSGSRISLIYYHFGSKDEIFQTVVDRRSEEHKNHMLGSLHNAVVLHEDAPVPLDILIEAYLRPCLERHQCHGPGWRNYIRLLAHLASESASSDYQKTFFTYDVVNKAFLNEFKRALPDAKDSHIYWGFYFLQTANINFLLDTQILDMQSEGQCSASDIDITIEQCQRFFTRGFTVP